MQVCSHMHQQYPEFGEEAAAALLEAFHSPLGAALPAACHAVVGQVWLACSAAHTLNVQQLPAACHWA